MNFKFTKNKTLTALGVGLFLCLIEIVISFNNCIGSCPPFSNQIKDLFSQLLNPLFLNMILLLIITGFIPIYLIWSFFEKK